MIRTAARLIHHVMRHWDMFGDEDVDVPDWVLDFDVTDLYHLRTATTTILRAARAALGVIDGCLEIAVGDDIVRVGDDILNVQVKKRRRVRDPHQFWAFVERLGPHAPKALFRPDSVRITALRKLAADQGIDPSAVDDTFFETETLEPQLTIRPVSVAPWELDEGERRRRK